MNNITWCQDQDKYSRSKPSAKMIIRRRGLSTNESVLGPKDRRLDKMAARIVPPEPFDFKHPELWVKWTRRFGRFRFATDLHKKSEEIQINSFLYTMGDAADDVLTTFIFEDVGDNLKYDKVKEKFDQYFTVWRNVIYE